MAEPTTRELGPADADAMLRVDERCVVDGQLTLRFDRGEDWFRWPSLCFDRVLHVGAEHDGELVGYGLIGGFEGRVGAGRGRCFYTGDARVLPAWRRARVIDRVVSEGIDRLWPDTHDGYGIVMVGNTAGERMAASVGARPAFPGVPAGVLEAAVIPVIRRWRRPAGVDVRAATEADAPACARLYAELLADRPFAPVPTAEEVVVWMRLPGLDLWLATEGTRARGVLGTWDLTNARAYRVLRYAGVGRVLKAAIGLASRVVPGLSPLPAPGGLFRMLTTTRVAAASPTVLRALLAAAVDRALDGRFHATNVALVGDDPLRPALRGVPRQVVRSTVHRFHRGSPPPRTERPYVDLSHV
ncbi:MAG: hypothetical protein H6738_18510 [Alphaproteobacteria bacterium]|nr:hypothetical protein [Alphaproteobacteria bacterium]